MILNGYYMHRTKEIKWWVGIILPDINPNGLIWNSTYYAALWSEYPNASYESLANASLQCAR